MAINEEGAKEIIEAVFTFDNVGSSMSAIRKDHKSVEKKNIMVKELLEAAIRETGDNSADSQVVLLKAAEARVERYAKGIAASQSGCGGLG